jgi:hypothetical protein
MKSTRTINMIGWIFIIFLSISKIFFSDKLSFITTGLGGIVCFIVGLILALYKPNSKV